MADEPFYIRQTADPASLEEQRDWIKAAAAEARTEGAAEIRVSVWPLDPRVILIEAWKAIPGNPGFARFAMAA